ncbi:MAG TPA: bifunctional diaminohydroxyphosphoribosylaminopyrimidine deaminase/5-amino-6-(5-phosphoribosylamino)uracil reductase RibD [bacterium]|nr:bifunctional diaminohydroxyphosphoribosylaminopyrimidine deaminase/5-amino-6-(5-phosphoribosylamino)uracil reductase RibD [bacterium]
MRERLHDLMARAAALARNGGRAVFPNPMVGAVIFDDAGTILAEGWHRCCGGDHAEIDALKKLGRPATGLSMAVTLEPCNHFGKTPPCSHALVNAGIKKVYIAALEPTDRACGGCSHLAHNGIPTEFVPGFENDLAELNRFFYTTAKKGRPWVTLKAATTIDGFIALPNGASKYISCPEALAEVHRMRAGHMAIAVGAATVNCDDPLLTVRHVAGPDPLPVIFSERLNLRADRKLLDRAPVIFTAVADADRLAPFTARGCRVETVTTIGQALRTLWEKYRINSLLVEGGATLHAAFLAGDMADELVRFIAPFHLGDGIALRGAPVLTDLTLCRDWQLHATGRFGVDAYIVWRRGAPTARPE